MQTSSQIMNATQQPYTILRIKRKRTDEPLDALVVESRVRRKKTRGGVDVFQFAETVEPNEWDDERRARELQNRISALARERPSRAVQAGKEARPKADTGRQYTVITQEEQQSRPRIPVAPPQVMSAKELERQQQQTFKLYDAVLASEAVPSQPPSEMDPEMEKFQSLLKDYLTVHDITPDIPPTPASNLPASGATLVPVQIPPPPRPSEDRDYVWDVFYHRTGASKGYENAVNVGTLTGLPASFTESYSSGSESEEEDEADEDSNAEDFYRNDYPDEETDSEGIDEFHEHSDYDDIIATEDEDRQWQFGPGLHGAEP
ncbi:hypothetical protein EW146_g48 [Bondarzewia mesenterica]|uniref:Probable RNA polymerase II nuclear localization protein SLC7A6OS n=1 Tax=Bondarzewia mesenterica TaxID=1095465 RepID=A0A4S4M8V7_9AGAM|nr:hypothetical protein EW146_g48 [Bondarzewia mesenterica]